MCIFYTHKIVFADDMIVYVENQKESTTSKINKQLTARLQDTKLICKSELLSYMPTMYKWNLKLKA